ncbi:MAG: methionine--tRNA ligase [Bacteroidota bacterium]
MKNKEKDHPFKRYTVTSALPYANGPLHIGHIAGAYLPADIYVRYLRIKGEDVVFVCGSDEHGAAITLRAKKDGVSPGEIIDKYHELNKKAFKDFGIAFNIFHRTSSELHHKTASDFFTVLNDNGEFTIETSEQYYDEEHQQFLADRYITGICPRCGYESAYGDQCEKCGSSLSPKELINPRSTLSGNKPVLKKTKHWYLPMDKYEGWLKEWILQGHKDDWKPNVYGQCKSWIEGGLKPRAMTRDLDWGVKVPLEEAEGKVLYVWLDAPIGYISATKQWAIDNDKNWKDYWMDDEAKLVHFIGKDNIVFHSIIFPILLKAHGNFILPDNVPANEFLNLEGDKFSTSRNHAVWLSDYLEDFPGKQDELRYTLTKFSPETSDNEFTWKNFQACVNNELVATLGNFVNRVMQLIHKYFDGIIPFDDFSVLNDDEKSLLAKIAGIHSEIPKLIEKYRFRDALSEAMKLAQTGNKYLADKEPWKLNKEEQIDEIGRILSASVNIIAWISILIDPFLPNTASRLTKMLGRSFNESIFNFPILQKGHQLNPPELLFEKIENEVIEKQINKLRPTESQIREKKGKPMISFEDFAKLDIRTGMILSAEKVKDTDKLLKLTVDIGFEKRTVVAGIAENYNPDEIIGQQVSMLVNLAPRKLKGIESQGMILMAENEGGELAFMSPTKEMKPGSEIR